MVVSLDQDPAHWTEHGGPNRTPPKHVQQELEREQYEREAADARLEHLLKQQDCADCGAENDKAQYRCDDCKSE